MMLEHSVIIVVGGTTGLGLSGAAACARAGASLVIVGRHADSAQAAVRTISGPVEVVLGDASKPEVNIEAVDVALKKFGRVDGLYHVAGGSGRKQGDGPLHELTDEGIDYTLDLNLKSVLFSNRAVVKAFMSQGTGGSILNMSSVLAHSPSPHFFSTHAYAAAKAGIVGFTKSAAAYYAGLNIRFNVVSPALVETPMAARAAGNEEILKFIQTKQPLDGGRIGQPSDLDEAVVYFLSTASKFVTGQVLSIDGGWGVSEGQFKEPRQSGMDS